MKDAENGGSRIAIVFNGSPLFNGGPNSGESAIRRWIIENDWLEAIVGLPERLFYNTDIHTYIWILSNRKSDQRTGKVQLVDAREIYTKMRKNLGDKGNKLSNGQIDKISSLFSEFNENDCSKIVDNREFGYRRIVIDRPLRLSFKVSEERIASLDKERAFSNRSESKQEDIKLALNQLPENQIWNDRDEFHNALNEVFESAGISVSKSVIGNIENALGERDPEANICRDNKGDPEHDIDLREQVRIPLDQDPHEYLEQEVKPHMPNAWINTESKRYDEKDGQLGVVGYEINFEEQFYTYEPPRSLEEINREIESLEQEIESSLTEMM
jgi:type I restriction enzyme M protein